MTEAKKNWYSTGYQGIAIEKDRIARAQGPNRYWMHADDVKSRDLVFIDDDPFCIYEHNPQVNGSFTNQFSCLKDSSDIIPCCEKLGEKSRYYVGYYTVIDLTENIDAKGNKYQYEIKLLPAKLKTLALLQAKKQDQGSLKGKIFKVRRLLKDDPNVGGVYDYVKDADLSKLFNVVNYKGKKLTELYKEGLEKPEVLARLKDTFQLEVDDKGMILPKIPVFNYPELLKPLSPSEVRQKIGSAQVEAAAGGRGATTKDDEIPF